MTHAAAANDEVPAELRARLALVLDVDDRVAALRLAKELQPWFGVAKVGLELFAAAGPPTLQTLMDLGYEVFLDLKLHDIPNTVNRAAAVVGAYGVKYLTIHAMAGATVLKAGVDGFLEGASRAGAEPLRRPAARDPRLVADSGRPDRPGPPGPAVAAAEAGRGPERRDRRAGGRPRRPGARDAGVLRRADRRHRPGAGPPDREAGSRRLTGVRSATQPVRRRPSNGRPRP